MDGLGPDPAAASGRALDGRLSRAGSKYADPSALHRAGVQDGRPDDPDDEHDGTSTCGL